jgi:hypothetical protein
MRGLIVLLGLACALFGCGGSTATSATAVPRGPLRWAPPALHDPTTILLGRGYSDTTLDPERDYVIRLPSADKRGGVTIEGGHDVVVIGGHVTLPSGAPPGAANDRYRTGLYLKGQTGTVHVEGVLFDAAPGVRWDAIDIDAPAATVQLENVRADGVRGGFHSFHADVVQPWGGVRALRIDHLSASSNYQGLTLPIDEGPIGSAQVSHVDLHGLSAGAQGTGHLLWLTTGSRTCRSYPVALHDVYVRPRAGETLGETVWPQRGHPGRCAARTHDAVASWPRLRRIRGDVRAGAPPGGSYVPPGVAGVGYVSPGYAVP